MRSRPDRAIAMSVTIVFATIGLSTRAAPPTESAAPPRSVLLPATEFDLPAGAGAMASSLALDASGGLWLSWLEPVATSHSSDEEGDVASDRARRRPVWSLRAARLDSHAIWSPVSTVAAGTEFFANWADTPGVVAASEQTIYAHYLERIDATSPYAYGVVLTRSDDRGATWLRLGMVHTDRHPGEHGFVSTAGQSTPIRIAWLDGRAMTGDGHDEGSGDMTLMARTLTPGREHQNDETILDARTCECCNTGMAMTSRGPIVVYRDRSDDERRDISIVRQVDGQWTEPRDVAHDGWILPGCPVNGPAIAAVDRTVVVAWYTAAEGRAVIKASISTDCGESFGNPIIIADEMDDARLTPHGRVAVTLDRHRHAAYLLWLGDAGDREQCDLPLVAVSDADQPDYDRVPTGALRLTLIDLETGAAGETRTIALADASRSGGFPRLAMLGPDRLFLAWTDTTAGRQLRGAMIPLRARDPR